jgi:hypothetical protein
VAVTLHVVEDELPASGLVSWMTLTSGSGGNYIYKDSKNKVSRWNDLSGKGNHAMQSVGSKKPLYAPKGLGTSPALQFNGLSRLMFAAKAPGITGGAPFKEKTIGIVFRTGANFKTRQMLYEQGSVKRGLSVYIDTDSTLYVNAWNMAGDSGSKPWGPVYAKTAVKTNTLYFVEMVFDQPNGKLSGYLNGTLFGSATGLGVLSNDPGPGVIGGVYQKVYSHDGKQAVIKGFAGLLAEFMYYSRVLTDVERATIEGIMAAKYSLGSSSSVGTQEAPEEVEVEIDSP